MTIAAIETRYAGHRFRSRLEARWAVFFDHLGINWQYEPQGYVLPDGSTYLPDFLIHPETDMAFWFEVKGTHPSAAELSKAQQLADGTALATYVYFGEISLPGVGLSTSADSVDSFYRPADGGRWTWDNKVGWIFMDQHPREWQLGLDPTAYRLSPTTESFPARPPKSGSIWWTDCGRCGSVVLKLHGQQGYCPMLGDEEDPGQLYPNFRHETERLISAYAAGRSARFEHGESG